ncbi:PREDICTED: interferon alpha-inducible protein 6 [Chrysochloris asiatica]|uniref:Interferon alpha-inducible protein 6 n=1 Tax=Chrysochloris asiatica TaxID=185453 RepID=A0A9B0TIN9_CHRAS|nr:PREDICTED: interferon alpha-inducible protein 6 [Chrysochloris asiatica]
MRQKAVSLCLCYLLLFASGQVEAGKKRSEDSDGSDSGLWGALPYMAIGGGLMVAGLPLLGFTGAGIAANSVASWMMSCSAVLNGGGVPAGGVVATMQSLGATGSTSLMAKVGAFLGYNVYNTIKSKDDEED